MKSIAIQALAVAIFVLVEHYGADWRFFVELRRAGFEWTSSLTRVQASATQISDTPLVVLVDLAGFPESDLNGKFHDRPTGEPLYTHREFLNELAVKLAAAKPAAIGFDIDMSANRQINAGAAPHFHREFLASCLKLSQEAPIFLGVGRSTLATEAVHWLGQEDAAGLAAGVYLMTEEKLAKPPVYSLIPLEFSFTAPGGPALPSMSYALSQELKKHHPGSTAPRSPPTLLQGSLFVDHRITVAKEGEDIRGVVKSAYNNFEPLKDLHNAQIKGHDIVSGRISAEALRQRIYGKVVLVGDADIEQASDKIIVPGQRHLIPGIYAHACGVLTLHDTRLWHLDPDWLIMGHASGWVASVLLAVALTQACAFIARRLPFARESHVRAHLLQLVLVFVAVLSVAAFFAFFWSALWTAAIACLVAACFETWFVLGAESSNLH